MSAEIIPLHLSKRDLEADGRLLRTALAARPGMKVVSPEAAQEVAYWLYKRLESGGISHSTAATGLPGLTADASKRMDNFVRRNRDRAQGPSRNLALYTGILDAIAGPLGVGPNVLLGEMLNQLPPSEREQLRQTGARAGGSDTDPNDKLAGHLQTLCERLAERLPLGEAARFFKTVQQRGLVYDDGHFTVSDDHEIVHISSIASVPLFKALLHVTRAPCAQAPSDKGRFQSSWATEALAHAESEVRVTLVYEIHLAVAPIYEPFNGEPINRARVSLLWVPKTLVSDPVRPGTWHMAGGRGHVLHGWRTMDMFTIPSKDGRLVVGPSDNLGPDDLIPDAEIHEMDPYAAYRIEPATRSAWRAVLASRVAITHDLLRTIFNDNDRILGDHQGPAGILQQLFLKAPPEEQPHVQLQKEIYTRLRTLEAHDAALDAEVATQFDDILDNLEDGRDDDG